MKCNNVYFEHQKRYHKNYFFKKIKVLFIYENNYKRIGFPKEDSYNSPKIFRKTDFLG